MKGLMLIICFAFMVISITPKVNYAAQPKTSEFQVGVPPGSQFAITYEAPASDVCLAIDQPYVVTDVTISDQPTANISKKMMPVLMFNQVSQKDATYVRLLRNKAYSNTSLARKHSTGLNETYATLMFVKYRNQSF